MERKNLIKKEFDEKVLPVVKQHTIKIKNRIKAAIDAFRGKPVTTMYFGVGIRRCSECEYKGNHPRVIYLCDGKGCERAGEIGHCCNNECKYTSDVTHARNFSYNAYTDTFEEIDCSKEENKK